jgi:hypothetical protein
MRSVLGELASEVDLAVVRPVAPPPALYSLATSASRSTRFFARSGSVEPVTERSLIDAVSRAGGHRLLLALQPAHLGNEVLYGEAMEGVEVRGGRSSCRAGRVLLSFRMLGGIGDRWRVAGASCRTVPFRSDAFKATRL